MKKAVAVYPIVLLILLTLVLASARSFSSVSVVSAPFPFIIQRRGGSWMLGANVPGNLRQHLGTRSVSVFRDGSTADSEDFRPSLSPSQPINGSAGEIVGSTGRIGSYLLRSSCSACSSPPRGVSPGCSSPPGTPIFVTVPTNAIPSVIESTLRERRKDLILVGNGIPELLVERWREEYGRTEEGLDWTVSVPHFAVLEVGGPIVTSPLSPPTIVYGKHSKTLKGLLAKEGVKVEIVNSMEEVNRAAIRKLMWASIMWLLCHDGAGDSPLTVEAVHKIKSDEVKALVEEILPAALLVAGPGGQGMGSVDEVMEFLESYSFSMPTAVPARSLAIGEIEGRNGVFLSLRDVAPQPLHKGYIQRVAGLEVLDRACCVRGEGRPKEGDRWGKVASLATGLTFLASPVKSSKPKHQTAIIVGAGIVGSSLCLSLVCRGIDVKLLDRRPIQDNDTGATTPASWAWINANGKGPPSYRELNKLGMICWRRHETLKDLPSWCGSLVRRPEAKGKYDATEGGAYAVECLLSRSRVEELEPNSSFLGDEDEKRGDVYFYPDEGFVDPEGAVLAIRRAAEKESMGNMSFVGGVEVTGLVREGGRVVGLTFASANGGDEAPMTELRADVVIVAAGAGSSSPQLVGLPMLHRPGVIAYAKPTEAPSAPSGDDETASDIKLNRILVDVVNKSHILQRKDGTLVVGGGFLELGGNSSSADHAEGCGVVREDPSSTDDAGNSLLSAAAKVTPSVVQNSKLTRTELGYRPIPQDGLPVVGYYEEGLYTVVTHSGMTLGLLLGELSAMEICSGVELDLLKNYRPGRFSGDRVYGQDGEKE